MTISAIGIAKQTLFPVHRVGFFLHMATDYRHLQEIVHNLETLNLYSSEAEDRKSLTHTGCLRGHDHYSSLSYVRLQPVHTHFLKSIACHIQLFKINDTSSYVHSWVVATLRSIYIYGLKKKNTSYLFIIPQFGLESAEWYFS